MKELIFCGVVGMASLGALAYQAEAGTWLMVAIAVFNVGFVVIARRKGRERRAMVLVASTLALFSGAVAAFITPYGAMWLVPIIGIIDAAMIWRWRWSTI